MTVRNQLANRRRSFDPLETLCLATSLAAAVTAGVAVIVDQFVAPCPIAMVMLAVSAFYLLLGVGYSIQRRLVGQRPAKVVVVAPSHLAIEREVLSDDDANGEVPVFSTEREMAQV